MAGYGTSSHKTDFCSDKYASVFFCTPAQTATLLRERRQLLLLIRHGITDWNVMTKLQGRIEIPLNEKGREQAYYCGIGIKNAIGERAVKGVFSSPLSRAYDTAERISCELEAEAPTVLESLNERDYGSATGLTFEERRLLYQKNNGYPSDMESADSAAIRMKKTVKEIVGMPGNGISVIVTHGGLLNSFFSYITGGRAGSGGHIAANCTVEVVASGRADVIPVAFNLSGDELKSFLDEVYQKI